MRRWSVLTCAILLIGGTAMRTSAQEVQLDISSGFNWDIFCGVKEYQALVQHELDYWGIDLFEMQGNDMMGVGTQHNGPNCLVSYNYMLVSNVDASVAEALGCMLDGTTYLGYAGPNDASWLKPESSPEPTARTTWRRTWATPRCPATGPRWPTPPPTPPAASSPGHPWP